jgi:hypothetical protein
VLLSPFSVLNLRGRSKEEMKVEEEEEEESELDMVSAISFTQANLQRNIAIFRVISRTVSVKEIYMVLIQEPWQHEGRIRDLNIPGYTLFSGSGTDRLRACILMRIEAAWMLLGFSCRDLVAVLIKYNEEGTERRLVYVLHTCPTIPRILLRQRNLRNSCDIVKIKTSI